MIKKSASQFSGGKILPEKLAQMKNDKYWDEEQVTGQYFYPLSTKYVEEIFSAGQHLVSGIPKNQLYTKGPFLCCTSPTSHIGPYRWAIDFLVLDGSEILAARNGEVIECVDGFSEWGDDPEFASRMNLITIQHGNADMAEFSQYAHLTNGSLCVKLGDSVKAGEVIAQVGKVGYTDRDHLHFVVFRRDLSGPTGFKSLKIGEFANPQN